jgi:hypothetical protein
MAMGRDGQFQIAQKGDGYTLKAVSANRFVGLSRTGGILLNAMATSNEYTFSIQSMGHNEFSIKNAGGQLSIQNGQFCKHFAPFRFRITR